MRCLTLRFGATSLLAIPAIFWVIKNSDILEEKDTKDHLKMFKALDVDNNNLESFVTFSLIFSIMLRIINLFTWVFWLPLKLAIIFYILEYLNYDVTYIYHKINNLSLGVIDWYYQTLIDFIESLKFKNEFYIIADANTKKT
jgi:hypothetical protein